MLVNGEPSIGMPSPEKWICSHCDLDLLTSKCNMFISVQKLHISCKFYGIPTSSS